MRTTLAAICGLSLLLTACGDSAEADAELGAPTADETEMAEVNAIPSGPLVPQDECTGLEDFDLFRGQLRRAVLERNADALMQITDENVKLDFGGGSGVEEFRKRLGEGEDLWVELGDAVGMGCASSGPENASFPWIFDNVPEGYDSFASYLVTGNDVPIHESADAASAQVGAVGWDMVERVGDGSPDQSAFVQVRTADDTEGYVASEYLRSPIDYRVIAAKGDDGWKIASFVAGD